MQFKTVTSKIILSASLSINALFLLVACDKLNLPNIEVCIPQSEFDSAYCGTYSLTKLKFIEPLESMAYEAVNDAFCISQDSWLTKLKPTIKEHYRARDKKKKLIIGQYRELRDRYEIR